MDNDNMDRPYVIKPGFSLVKYGHVLAFNFNLEFAQRFNNVLADFHKNVGLEEPILSFFTELCYHLDLPAGVETDNPLLVIERFDHVFSVSCDKKFAQNLNEILKQFLLTKRVSTALFCFAKQLEGCLFPRFEGRVHNDSDNEF
jgi:hypothetical protein